MDLSYSMKDDLENVKKLGSDIHAALHGVTKSVRIGFGSFVDKTVLPYVSTVSSKLQNPCPSRTERCQPPFSYRHVLSLTSNLTLFQLRVSAENISGNLDAPEGGLDAMLQAAVCTNHIGWRNVTRLLVFASDDVFHTAGDGKLGGIYLPSDGRCHLNENGEYDRSHIYDYPSVGHLAQVLSAANIQPIFAVTSSFISTYQELSELIPKSVVGELKEDSSNVVNLISEACSEGHRGKNCECRPDEDDTEAGCWGEGSLPCSGRGRCECGHCLCNIHVRGKLCDCDDASCERHEGHLCGGISRGVCNCGTCECSSNYTGSACSCSGDTSACTANGEVCSGHGRCVCNKCDCDTGYFNRLCSECPGCQTPCKKHRNCTECKAFGTGPLSDKCSLFCEHTNVTVIQASESGVGESGEWCQEKGTDSLLTFRVLKEEGTLVYIVVMDKQEIADQTQNLILGLVLGIVFIGLLFIVAYRIAVETFDRKEYKRFQQERMNEEWNKTNNPLYQSATTTVLNPNFNQD
ncbi:hypothetical protein FKM82_009488 [Ascaphus truei]